MTAVMSTSSSGALPDMMDVANNASRGRKRRFSGKQGGRGRKLTKRQVNEVKTIMHREQELKYFFFRQATFNVTSTFGNTGAPFDVAQGDTDNTRDGDRLRWCGTLEMNLQIVNGQGATGDVYNNVRVVIFQWHPNSVPGATDVFITGPSTAVDIYSVYNHDTRQQYTILFDRVFKTVGNANAATTPNTNEVTTGVHFLRIPLKRARKDVQYVAGGLTGTNRIYLGYCSDSALATHPTMTFMTKIFYRDS